MEKSVISSLFSEVAVRIAECIKSDVKNGRCDVSLALDAYNYFCDTEAGGKGYVFDINDKHDLKVVVDNGLSACDISFIYTKHVECPYFGFDNEGRIMLYDNAEVIDKVMEDIVSVVKCVLLYVGRAGEGSPYTNLYEKYVTENLISSNFIC